MKTLHTFSSTVPAVYQAAKTIKADVVFGSPSKRCIGIGICKVNPHNSLQPDLRVPCCQKVDSEIQQIAPDLLEFRFSRAGICKKLIARQFAFSRFRIDDCLQLPDWLTAAFQLAPVQLVKGAYLVRFTPDFICVRIRVKA